MSDKTTLQRAAEFFPDGCGRLRYTPGGGVDAIAKYVVGVWSLTTNQVINNRLTDSEATDLLCAELWRRIQKAVGQYNTIDRCVNGNETGTYELKIYRMREDGCVETTSWHNPDELSLLLDAAEEVEK